MFLSVSLFLLAHQNGDFSIWNGLFLVPLGIVTYFSALTMTILAATPADDEDDVDVDPLLKAIHEDLKAGKLEAGSEEMFERMRAAGVSQISPIGEVSDTIIGKLNGHDIYEWVEIQNPANEQFYRFEYYGPGEYEADGTPVMPIDGELSFAHVNGIVYAADLSNLK